MATAVDTVTAVPGPVPYSGQRHCSHQPAACQARASTAQARRHQRPCSEPCAFKNGKLRQARGRANSHRCLPRCLIPKRTAGPAPEREHRVHWSCAVITSHEGVSFVGSDKPVLKTGQPPGLRHTRHSLFNSRAAGCCCCLLQGFCQCYGLCQETEPLQQAWREAGYMPHGGCPHVPAHPPALGPLRPHRSTG